MQIVKVRLPAGDLSREMAAMREWLDSNRYEPAKFTCDQDGVDVVVSVNFMLDEAAAAFAKRFDGEDGPKSSLGDSAPQTAT
jgi:basic membrane lipoprotein Med (substrate-binding protein (PBP1-ABC) superfamily)